MKYIFLFVLLGFMASCINDESREGNLPVSTLSFLVKLEEGYTATKNTEFVLPAPAVTQENQQKPLSYEWEINYKLVSTESELRYFCDSCGTFPCRLKIYNEDGAIFSEFKLNVPFPYQEGILLLSDYDNRPMLSFKSLNPEKPFALDVFERNNPGTSILGTIPRDICFYNNNYGNSYIYVATENPVRLVKLEHNTMKVLNVLSYPEEHISRLMPYGYSSIFITGNGRSVSLDCATEYFSNSDQQKLQKYNPSVHIADKVVLTKTDWGSDKDYIFFDESTKTFLNIPQYSSTPVEICTSLKGASLLDMFSGRVGDRLIAIVKKTDGKLLVSLSNTATGEDINQVEVPGTAGMTENSIFLACSKEDVLVYASGNKIYRYYYSSYGNFPTDPDYIVGDSGEVIKTMLLDANEEKLYVATDSPSGEYRGNVYCYDYKTKELLWQEKGVAGTVVSMLYKTK